MTPDALPGPYTRQTPTEENALSRTTILAILALPAGAVGYFATANLLSGMALPDGAQGFLLFVVPLFVGGLCIAALLLPTFDRMAKRDLAAHRASQADEGRAGEGRGEPPSPAR